jgi:general secretion pathway protein C
MTLNFSNVKDLLPSLPGWVEVLLVLAMSWMSAGLIAKPIVPPVADIGSVLPEESAYSVNIKELIAATPFGQSASRRTDNQPVVKSKLAIKLLGTIVAGEQSAALIKAKPGTAEEVYYLGEAIMPGVILREIAPTQIMIEVSGRREIILLDDSAPAQTSSFQKTVNTQRLQGNRHRVGISRNPVTGIPVQRLKLSRSVLEREMQDMAKLMTQARITPYMENGETKGFQISEITPGSIYQRIGLRNGDVIKSINGLNPSNIGQAASIIQVLREGKSVEALIQRNKRSLKLRYEIQ